MWILVTWGRKKTKKASLKLLGDGWGKDGVYQGFCSRSGDLDWFEKGIGTVRGLSFRRQNECHGNGGTEDWAACALPSGHGTGSGGTWEWGLGSLGGLVVLPQDKTESVSWQKLIRGMVLGSLLQPLQNSPKLNFSFLSTSLLIAKFPPFFSSVSNFSPLCCFPALLLKPFQAQDCLKGLFVFLLPDSSLKQPQVSVKTQALPLFSTQAFNRAWKRAEAGVP